MPPNDSSEQPLIPRRWASMHDSEHGSDVVFIVGEERERVPGHRDILARANPVFHSMLKGPLATAEPIPIVDIDPRAFDHLLRYLYKEEVRIQSVTTALFTLSAAHKYICEELVDACVTYVDAHLTTANALEVLAYVLQFTRCSPPLPSAPPLHSPVHPPLPTPHPPSITCDDLLHNTLQFIDNRADKILAQEHVEDLDLDVLRLVLCRDTLRVSSELVVCRVLSRWCHRECKRKQLALTEENKRAVLGEDLVFTVRFLLLDEREFVDGPLKAGLLDPVDARLVFAMISGGGPAAKKFEELAPVWRTERRKPDTGVRPLSSRTYGGVWKGEGLPLSGRDGGKKGKKAKKRSASLGSEQDKRKSGSKVLDCFFGAVSCMFD